MSTRLDHGKQGSTYQDRYSLPFSAISPQSFSVVVGTSKRLLGDLAHILKGMSWVLTNNVSLAPPGELVSLDRHYVENGKVIQTPRGFNHGVKLTCTTLLEIATN